MPTVTVVETIRKAMNAYSLVVGHEAVIARFGRWPSFHDGEVHRLVLDSTRTETNGSRYASVELLLRGWNLTEEVSESGFYKLEAESLVHLLFEHVYDVELDGLNHQNVLSGMELSFTPDPDNTQVQHIAVDLEHCYGLSGTFKAARASVLSVIPYVAPSAA